MLGRRTITDICAELELSYPKLIKEFDKIKEAPDGLQEDLLPSLDKALNLQADATFFGRDYGFLVFHDGNNVIYIKEIVTESVKHFREALLAIKARGYAINSITIDGRRGYIKAVRKVVGRIPIQMCLFHQKAIIRRYITDKPRSDCGKELQQLLNLLCQVKKDAIQVFIDQFYLLENKYHGFLHERNEMGQYKHQALRSAFKSLNSHMMYLFTYNEFTDPNIPSTNNRLEGLFSHLKERIKIHRGLNKNRKKKAVKFLLKNLGKNSKK